MKNDVDVSAGLRVQHLRLARAIEDRLQSGPDIDDRGREPDFFDFAAALLRDAQESRGDDGARLVSEG